jgi:hypothetical protein
VGTTTPKLKVAHTSSMMVPIFARSSSPGISRRTALLPQAIPAPQNPARLQTEELSFGKAHVFYPEADASRCTVALLLEVDPIALVRGRKGPAGEGGQLEAIRQRSPVCRHLPS